MLSGGWSTALFWRVARRLPPTTRRRIDDRARHRHMATIALGRARPHSEIWGFDRGQPIDRWYIERFVCEHETDIRDRVLEVQSPQYAAPHGRDNVTSMTVIDNDPDNTKATIIADLNAPGALAHQVFDC